MDSGNHQISIDVANLATDLQRELGTLHPLSKEYCIYRVPKLLRQSNEKNYTPRIVSIGPFHHGREDFKTMEELKRGHLENFLRRAEASWGDILEVGRNHEARIRNSYAEIVEFDGEDFVRMILVDAVFIIEVFLGYRLYDSRNAGEPIYDKPWLITDVKHEIPFFILQKLFDRADLFPGSNGKPSLVKFTLEFRKCHWAFFGVVEKLDEGEYSEVLHLVDLLRIFMTPSELLEEKRPKTLTTPRVTALHQAGVRFKPRSSSKSLFDISFNNGLLEIPRLRICSSLEILLKILVAYE